MEIKEYKMIWFKTFPWFAGYFISGYLISKYREKIKIENSVVILTILFLVASGIFLNFYFYKHFNVVIKDGFVLDIGGPFNYLITISIFYAFLTNRKRLLPSKLILSISDASFGIYLLHPFIIYLLRRIMFNDYLEFGYLFMLGSILIVFLVSYFFISLIRKISIAKYIC
jgi:peptidoglycan/LPS O-acetylase OafA/YrhL